MSLCVGVTENWIWGKGKRGCRCERDDVKSEASVLPAKRKCHRELMIHMYFQASVNRFLLVKDVTS